MDLSRTHESLTSLVVSVMLTSAFLASAPHSGITEAGAGPQPQAIVNVLSGLRASGWAGTTEMPDMMLVSTPHSAAGSAESIAEPSLTGDQQKKLAALMAAYGHDVALSQPVTDALGLSKGGEVLTLRQLTVDEHPELHTYIPLADRGFIFFFIDTTAARSYRLDGNFKFVAAVSKKKGQEPVVIPISDAYRNVQAEIAYWAALADKH